MNALLETKRLRLSTWSAGEADELFALHSDPEVNTYLASYNSGWTPAAAAARVEMWMEEHARHGLGKHRLTLRENGNFVGRAGFSIGPDGIPELGYSFLRQFWGQGFATEIAAALRDWFFATRNDPAFVAFTEVDNEASCRVLEKIGMTATGNGDINGVAHRFYRIERGQTMQADHG